MWPETKLGFGPRVDRAALDVDGSYYLPYQLQATEEHPAGLSARSGVFALANGSTRRISLEANCLTSICVRVRPARAFEGSNLGMKRSALALLGVLTVVEVGAVVGGVLYSRPFHSASNASNGRTPRQSQSGAATGATTVHTS